MIAVTLGDPNGIGPEIVLKAWASKEVDENLFVVGDFEVLRFCSRRISVEAPLHRMSSLKDFEPGRLNVLDLHLLRENDLSTGQISEKAGRAAIRYVEEAVRCVLRGEARALCTLPLNKEAVRLTQPDFTGHTAFIARMCGVGRYTMMLVSERLVVTHVSTHVPLAQAISLVTRDRVLEVIVLTHTSLARLKDRPRIAVSGLNPHAGEHGLFGTEEDREILPAIAAARERGIDAMGPEPPDTVFFRASRGAFDAVVCMYHDQGHIPLKLLDFEGGVNVTLGLPIVRTSVDHGTGFDIAYKGVASTRSFVAAFSYARQLLSES